MFKRIVASAVAVAALSSGNAVPAFGATGTIQGNQCRITLSAEEYAAMYKITNGFYVHDLVTILSIQDAQRIVSEHYYFPTIEIYNTVNATLNDPKASNEDKEAARAYIVAKPAVEAFENCAKGKETQPKPESPLSSKDGKPNEAGIGLIVGGVIVTILGLVAAALPMLPAPLRALLPV